MVKNGRNVETVDYFSFKNVNSITFGELFFVVLEHEKRGKRNGFRVVRMGERGEGVSSAIQVVKNQRRNVRQYNGF